METIITVLESTGVFIVGLLARGGLVLAVLALLSLPLMLAAAAMRAAEALKRRQLGLREVAGLLFRPDLWYAPNHTWLARRRGGTLVVGLDDLALRLLPAVTRVAVPRSGTHVAKGEPIATLFAGGRALAIPSPVAGTIEGVNGAVLRDPGLVKRDGYGRGWLAAVAPADERYGELPRGDRAERFMRAESARWDRLLEEQLGLAAADGGQLMASPRAAAGEPGWQRLVAAFVGA
jgi:glycine cleavage system H lipoate-binding protein